MDSNASMSSVMRTYTCTKETSVVDRGNHVKSLRRQERSQAVLKLLVCRTHTATMMSKGTVRSTMGDAENKRERGSLGGREDVLNASSEGWLQSL